MKTEDKLYALMMQYDVSTEEQAAIIGCSRAGIKYKNKYGTYNPDDVDKLLIYYKDKGADIVSDPEQGWRIIFHSENTIDKLRFAKYLKRVKWSHVAKKVGLSRANLDRIIRAYTFKYKDAVMIADAIGCNMVLLKGGKEIGIGEYADFRLVDADKVFKALGYETAFVDKETGERLA